MLAVLHRIEAMPLSAAMRGSIPGSEWWFPIVEIVHVCALSVVAGSIFMVDLRLLGLTARATAVSRLSGEILPWTWTAFAAAVISGSLLLISKPHVYLYNTPFRCKFALMSLAAINMLLFHHGIYRRVNDWDFRLPPPLRARIAGGLSVLLWIGVIFCGRWVGFTL